MGSLSEDDLRFFDAYEDIASIPDEKSESFEMSDSHSGFDNSILSTPHSDVWINSPRSVKERRSKFLNWMEVGLGQNVHGNSLEVNSWEGELGRIMERSGAVLRKSGIEDEFCSTQSTASNSNSFQELDLKENFACRDRNLGGGMVCNIDEEGHDGMIGVDGEAGSEQSVTADDCETASRSFQQVTQKEMEEPNHLVGPPKGVKKGWLSRLRSISCVYDKQRQTEKLKHDDDDALLQYRLQRVKGRQCGKKTKELSALYKGQDIQAHEGSILTMKFSPDGQYLASAGEDGIVRLWQVLEDERSNELDVPEIDPSCVYFTLNHPSELKPLFIDKERASKLRSLRKTSNSACVVFPPKVFRILEKPLHEFRGHKGEILDLSWSTNNHLLSASEDKTVRLWRVGCDDCLKVFSHNNYVTCVQFNPVDDNYFMSGSIDGKVRIWAIPSCQVVDWTDIKDIVTAVCYRPDGQGGIVGSITGNCRFYNMSDSHLQLDDQICLQSGKKLFSKRITGFQFSPQDPTKVMVTCADSKLRILHGNNVICKYKGLSNATNQLSAYFTSDGKHIISACDDSNVYMWNCTGQEESASLRAKKIRSWERFSADASVAIPWCGMKYGDFQNRSGIHVSNSDSQEALAFSSPASFSLSQEYLLESFPKGSATWPEENLPTSSPLSASSAMHSSEYKFLKASCQSTANSHAWGLVVVTAGWDGRIRSFNNYGLPVPI